MLAFHIDLKRAMWRTSYLEDFVSRLARWGFDTVVYEVENKFQFQDHPLLAHADALTHEATRELAAFCRRQGLELIPLWQTLGHAESVVGLPEYAHWRETAEVSSQYDPLSSEVRDFLTSILDEIIEVTNPTEFFHLGGDETWSLGKSEKCRSTVDRIGIGGLYLGHMLPLFEHVLSRGLRPVIWADVALGHPEMLDRIPREVVLMDWDYETGGERSEHILAWCADSETNHSIQVDWGEYSKRVNPEFRAMYERYCVDDQTREDGTFRSFFYTDALRDLGFDVITASANRCFGDMVGTPDTTRHLANCFHSSRKGMKGGMGHLVTSWAVRHNHPELGLPGIFAATCGRDVDSPFEAAEIYMDFTADYFGVAVPGFAVAVEKAGQSFRLGQSYAIEAAGAALRKGVNLLDDEITELIALHGGIDQSVATMKSVKKGYEEALLTFEEMRVKVKRHAENLDFWMEGVMFNSFVADIALAVLKGELPRRRSELSSRLRTLEEKTKTLFASSYTPLGVESELKLRYGWFKEIIRN